MPNYTDSQVRAMLDLYKIAPAEANKASRKATAYDFATPSNQLEYGLLFVDKNCAPIPVDNTMLRIAVDLYGVEPEALNATFYKSREAVVGRHPFQLFVEQVIHYMGTYGRESAGLKPITLIPMQEIDVPDVDLSKMKVTVIHLVGNTQVCDEITKTLNTVKTPSKRIVNDVRELLPLLHFVMVDDIRSFELMTLVCDQMGVVPTEGKNFLRFLIYKTIGTTMVVNNARTAKAIVGAADQCGDQTYKLLSRASKVSLAAIFLRYKNLFLAFKSHRRCAPVINRLRRMANTYHRPLSDVNVQNYIALAIQDRTEDLAKVRKNMDNRELVKVMNAMALRMAVTDYTDAVFNVRNGRSFCKENAYEPLTIRAYDRVYAAQEELWNELLTRLPTMKDKVFYIPEWIEYPIPTTEKQFTGNYPWGTSIFSPGDDLSAPNPITVGVQWMNPSEDESVDLDLHCFAQTGEHFGWNASYKSGQGEVVYSGDMTNAPAPDGAAEAFWVKGVDCAVIFTLSEFRGPDNMDFKLALSSEKVGDTQHHRNFVMDPNELLFPPVPLRFSDNTNMTLGYLHGETFVLYGGNLSEGAVPAEHFSRYIEGIMYQQRTKASISSLLLACGATVVGTPEERDEALANGKVVVDLSPEALTASSLLDIVDGVSK